jgi:hypothetical protein
MNKNDNFELFFASAVDAATCKCHNGKWAVTVEIVKPNGEFIIVGQNFYETEALAKADQENFSSQVAEAVIAKNGWYVKEKEQTITGVDASKRFEKFARENNTNLH